MCFPENLKTEFEMEANPLLSGFTAEDGWERPSSPLSVSGSEDGKGKAKVFTRRKAGQNSAGRMPGKDPLVIDYHTLVPLFKVSQRQACQELGIGLSTMKRLCRKFGIKRWPASSAAAAREAEEITAQRSTDSEAAQCDTTVDCSVHNTTPIDTADCCALSAPVSDGWGNWSDEPCMSRSLKLNRQFSGFAIEDVITKLDVGFDDESPLMEGTPNKFATPPKEYSSTPPKAEWLAETSWMEGNLNHFFP